MAASCPLFRAFWHVAAVVVSDSLGPMDSAARQASLCFNISQSLLRLKFIEPGMPLQCSCLENPRDGGAWWAAVYGVAQSWTRLK